MVGFWLQSTARAFLVYEVTGSSAALGAVYLASYGPQLFLAPLIGLATDRWDRRRMVVATTVGVQLVAVVTAWLAATDRAGFVPLLVVSLVGGALLTTQNNAAMTLLPSLVPRQALSSAVALTAMSVSGTRIVGPLVAGALLPVVGATWLFLGQGVMLLPAVAVWCAVYLPPREAEPEGAERGLRAMTAGARHVRSTPVLSVPLGLLAVLAGIGYVHQPLALAYATDVLSDGDATLGVTRFGLLQGVTGIGAVLGVWAIASGGARRPALVMLGTGATLSIGLIGLGLSSSLPAAMACTAVLSMAQFANTNVGQVLAQHHAPEHLRGRVMAVTQVCSTGLFPFTSFGLAYVADAVGLRWTYVGSGAVCLVAVVLTLPKRRHLRLPELAPEPAGAAVQPVPPRSRADAAGAGAVVAHAPEPALPPHPDGLVVPDLPEQPDVVGESAQR